MKKISKKIWISILTVFLALGGICAWYVNDYYHCEQEALDILKKQGAVKITEVQEGYFLDGSGEKSAMIFYPGAKVEAESYLPILHNLAEEGIDCFLVEMPCNLAILGKNKADTIMDRYEYEEWYIGGHSLGGAMAGSYASEHLEELKGVAFFAAYATKSLEQEDFTVLSIYGSEDKILSMDKVKEGRSFVPDDYTEISIQGGNHAYFGNYGEQEGDGKAILTKEEQQNRAVESIARTINGEEVTTESK